MQVKIIAAAVPAVLGLIVLLVLLTSGGGGKKPESKTESNKSAEASSQQKTKSFQKNAGNKTATNNAFDTATGKFTDDNEGLPPEGKAKLAG